MLKTSVLVCQVIAHLYNKLSQQLKKGKSQISWILPSFKTRHKTAITTLYKSLVILILECCSVLWSPTIVGHIQSLENFQRSFIRKIKSSPTNDYWSCLKEMNVLSLQRWCERYRIMYIIMESSWKLLKPIASYTCIILHALLLVLFLFRTIATEEVSKPANLRNLPQITPQVTTSKLAQLSSNTKFVGEWSISIRQSGFYWDLWDDFVLDLDLMIFILMCADKFDMKRADLKSNNEKNILSVNINIWR